MAKVEKDPFRCFECGWTSQKWVGRCGECQAWGTVEEIAAPKKLSLVPGSVTNKATPIGEVDLSAALANQHVSLNSIVFLAAGLYQEPQFSSLANLALVNQLSSYLLQRKLRQKEFPLSIFLAKNLHLKFGYAPNALRR
jgi:hypothetical protein